MTVGDGVDSCTATVAAGECTLTLTTVGARSLTASYAGDSNFNPSTSTAEAHTVDKWDTTTAITSDTPAVSRFLNPVLGEVIENGLGLLGPRILRVHVEEAGLGILVATAVR